MSSRIVPTNIDGTFPVAGQDNSSQGFRDNFTNIKNNFTFARNEISDLQDNVLLKSALGGTTLNNDMGGTQLIQPQLKAWTESLVDLGAIDGDVTITFSSGNFQKLTTAGPVSIALNDWPTVVTGYGLVRVWVVVTDVLHTLTLPTSVTIGENDIAGYNALTRTITFDVPGNYIFDFSSVDGGENYLIFDLTRNRVQFRDPSFYFNEDVSPTFLIGFQDSLNLALTLATGNDTLQLRGSQTNYSGVLEHGNDQGIGVFSDNPVYASLGGNARVAGYSVASSRAYVDTETGLPVFDETALVQSNDYIGYVNFIAPTLNPFALPDAELAICDFGAIRGFVNGTSPYSPGGNIVISTKQDTISGPGYLTPALAIENDQSVKFYGKAVVSEIDASDNTVTLDINEYVDFENFSGEILINDFDNGYVYKFLVGSGNVWMLGTTNSNWTPALVSPTSNFTLASWVKMETLSGKYRFTNLASSREFSFYTTKTRNNV